MASVSLATIYANVLKDLGLNSADTTFQARATRWINKALDKAMAMNPSAEIFQISNATISTVADTATYDLPTTFIKLKHIRDDNNSTEIEILSHEQFDDRHPDPSSESTSPPKECTLEFDVSTGVHVLRLAPIPDDAYTLYYTAASFHTALSGSQALMYPKLETALEDWAIWEGSLVVYPENEYVNLRNELKQRAGESMMLWSGMMNYQKPAPKQIRTQMKRYIYE